MGRSQVEFNRRARGRGRHGRGERSENNNQTTKRRPPVVPVALPQEIPFDDDHHVIGDLDARADQLLSYGNTTSTALSQFQSTDEDETIFYSSTVQRREPVDIAEQMKRLNQRLESVPLKDRLRLPDFILEELYGKQETSDAPSTRNSETLLPPTNQVEKSAVSPIGLVKLDAKNEGEGNGKEEEEQDLDDWLDSVIQ